MTTQIDLPHNSTPALRSLESQTWTAEVPPEWVSFGGIQGGLVIGKMAESAARATGRAVTTISSHLLAPVVPGVVRFAATVSKAGRSTSSVEVTVDQGGRTLAHAHALTVADGTKAEQLRPDPPEHLVGEPEDFEVFALPTDFVPFAQFIEVRPTNGAIPGGGGPDPVFEAWIRLTTDEPLDQVGIAVLLDAMPPSLFAVWSEPRALPTVEMTMHFTPTPITSRWLIVRQEATWATDTYCVDDAVLHTPDGRLVGQSRQIRKFLR